MKQKTLYILGAIVVLIGGFLLLTPDTSRRQETVTVADHKNAEYVIDGQRVRLVNGISETAAAPGSTSKIVTQYFGNEVRHDLNGDGREDVVFLVTQRTGGSGTFYYVVAALNMPLGYIGAQGLLLGDRIAPQTTEMSKAVGKENIVVVNYADRKPDESFSVAPSVGKSIWLKLDPNTMQFGEVVQNFEGEAEPSRMSLSMKTWVWIRAVYADGKIVTPHKTEAFTMTFGKDGKFSATTDCNGAGGNYMAKDGDISFSEMMSTLMYCEGSEEAMFTKLLGEVQTYRFTSKGGLVLGLKFDSGSVVFH
jgi:heat shock protein HslJ